MGEGGATERKNRVPEIPPLALSGSLPAKECSAASIIRVTASIHVHIVATLYAGYQMLELGHVLYRDENEVSLIYQSHSASLLP
jgi:hypothetical protein